MRERAQQWLAAAGAVVLVSGMGIAVAAVPAQAKGSVTAGSGNRFYLNDEFSGTANHVFDYGDPGDAIFVGDWDGNRVDTLAIRRGNAFHVRQSNTSGPADHVFLYGDPGDEVFVGDWDGDGVDTLAIRRGNDFYVKNSVSSGVADHVVKYGDPGDAILVGDWNGDGVDTFAVRRGNQYFIKNSVTSGVADQVMMYGNPEDAVLTGDWNGDWVDSLAVRRGNTYFLKDSLYSGNADRVFGYGNPTDTVLAGDWNGDGTATIGVRRVPDYFEYSGYGDSVINIVKPGSEAPVIVTATHSGSRNFIVWGRDGQGSQTDLLVNTIGTYAGSTLLDENTGRWQPASSGLAITASGQWTIRIDTLGAARPFSGPYLEGHGDQVLVATGDFGTRADMRADGNRNFIVWSHSRDFGESDLLVNDFAPYQGIRPWTNGTRIIEVEATNNWSIARLW